MGVSTGTYTITSNPSDSNPSDRNIVNENTGGAPYHIQIALSTGRISSVGSYLSISEAISKGNAAVALCKTATSWAVYDSAGTRVTGIFSVNNDTGSRGNGSSRGAMLMDTGGYTGDWGSSEGRIAILHEKELVLNKTDTANMLNIVEMVRGIVSSFGNVSHGANANFNLGLSGYDSANSQFEQSVTINADFSGVSSRDEIQAAFDQMALQATQYMKKSK